jgi:hypothetical protein
VRWRRRREPRPDPHQTLADGIRETVARDARWRAEVARALAIAPTDDAEAHAILNRVEAEVDAALREQGIRP